MGRISKFEELEVWVLARRICLYVEYLFTNTQIQRNFGLKDQMERSSGSIMDNIVRDLIEMEIKNFIIS